MKLHYKTAGDALCFAFHEHLGNVVTPARWEQIAQAFLRSEWGESDPSCSECGQRGTHRTEDCPFSRTPLLFAEMAND